MAIAQAVALGTAAYALLCVLVWRFQTRLIFMPVRRLRCTPASLQIPGEEVNVSFRAQNGRLENLHGFWLPSDVPGSRVMLYLHGNGDNIGVNLPHAALLRSLGISVFLFDYRGYGQSSGEFPSEERVCEDAEAAWEYLVKERGVAPSSIVIYGHSLGGAVAIALASRHPDAASLIVESSFTSILAMARYTVAFRLFPLELLLRNRFDSLSKISSLCLPVLLVHGTSDWTVPSHMSRQLHEAATDPKTIVMIEGGHHLDNAKVGGESYLTAIREYALLKGDCFSDRPMEGLSSKIQSLSFGKLQ